MPKIEALLTFSAKNHNFLGKQTATQASTHFLKLKSKQILKEEEKKPYFDAKD